MSLTMLVQLVDNTVLSKVEITLKGLTLGRSVSNDIYLEDPSVSQKHAKLEAKELKDGTIIYLIKDLESTNHTFLNGNQVNESLLSDQDIILIGTNTFKFINEDANSLAQTKVFKKSWIPGMFYLKD